VATIIAVVAGLTLATSGAIAHDLYVNLIKKGNVRERDQVLAARVTAIVVGIVATLLGILAEGVNVAVLVILAICIAASANFPVLALSLFWRRFNTGGVIGGMGLGLISSVGLALIGPAYLGKDACGRWSIRPWSLCRSECWAPCSGRSSSAATMRMSAVSTR